MQKKAPSTWERFQWHPAVPTLLLIVISLILIRRPSFVAGAAFVVGITYLGLALAQRSRNRANANAILSKLSQLDEVECYWQDRKSAMMEALLGKGHDSVMHAMIPYAVGGALDLYYYPNAIQGVGIATQELSPSPDTGPSNAAYRQFELVMFTRAPLDLDAAHDEASAFGRAHRTISAILNCLAPYSEQATLNPGDTLEFPEDMERVGGKCLIFDAYGRDEGASREEFGVLAVIEIFRSEMEYAREHSSAALLERLKNSGVYPYSDLDREPVV